MNIISFYCVLIIYGIIFADQIGNNNMIHILNNNNIIFNQLIYNILVQLIILNNINLIRQYFTTVIIIIFMISTFSNLTQSEFKLEKIDIHTVI